VRLRLPIYVAATQQEARDHPYAGVMPYYERLRQGYLRSPQRADSAERSAKAAQLATLTYEEVLRERAVFGTPAHVTTCLRAAQRTLGLAGIIIEPNIGGGVPLERVLRSLDLFAQEVAPRLREKE
jgi:alkanesulfonate monooxygenase SsuD/methylene tetrahydromethanopterin reductase-like flavin-dependent oxidoreductase (luciferase family)